MTRKNSKQNGCLLNIGYLQGKNKMKIGNKTTRHKHVRPSRPHTTVTGTTRRKPLPFSFNSILPKTIAQQITLFIRNYSYFCATIDFTAQTHRSAITVFSLNVLKKYFISYGFGSRKSILRPIEQGFPAPEYR